MKNKRPALEMLRTIQAATPPVKAVTVYCCPICDTPYPDRYDARDCDCLSPNEKFVCPICWEKDEGDVETFDEERGVQEHFEKEHPDGETPHSQYIEALRFENFVGGQAMYEFERGCL